MTELQAEIKSLLGKISWKLSRGGILSGGNAANFTASIDLFSGDSAVGGETEAIQQILGNLAVVDFVSTCNWDELSTKFNECINWPGWDEHSQPNHRYQLSTEFSNDTSELLSKLERLFEDNVGIWEFELSNGHPFYPVYWDFAYVIRRPNRDYVFIGSSSD